MVPEPADAPPHERNNPVDALAILAVLVRERTLISRCAMACFVLAIAIAFALPKQYTARASFFPPGSIPSSSVSSAVSQLGQISSLGLLGGMTKTSGDLYAGILRSDSVLHYMVGQFHLMDVYKARRESQAQLMLIGNTKIVLSTKDPIVLISVTDRDPYRARDLANGYLTALEATSGNMALTDAAQRRLFFEKQLAKEKNALADAEVELKKSEEKTGVFLPSGQTVMQINTIARTRAEIASRQVQMAALGQMATNENPEMIRLRSELTNLQNQLKSLQAGASEVGNLPTAKVPEVALEYVRKQREVKYHETLFELVARQYEIARIDEAKEGPAVQILDHARVPDSKSGPHRLLIILGGLIFGTALGCLWAFVRSNHSLALAIARLRE